MSCSVLVVDDEFEIRQLLSTMLTMMGYQSFMAQDGLDALEKIPQYQPDILILGRDDAAHGRLNLMPPAA
jgi:CheY-like chemotaxis protein